MNEFGVIISKVSFIALYKVRKYEIGILYIDFMAYFIVVFFLVDLYVNKINDKITFLHCKGQVL